MQPMAQISAAKKEKKRVSESTPISVNENYKKFSER